MARPSNAEETSREVWGGVLGLGPAGAQLEKYEQPNHHDHQQADCHPEQHSPHESHRKSLTEGILLRDSYLV